MNAKQRIALAWPPLCLRLALALTFMWAGAGKLLEYAEVRGQGAADLANMGVKLGGAPARESAPEAQPTPKPTGPDKPIPEPDRKEPEKKDTEKKKEGAARGGKSGSSANGKPPRTAITSTEPVITPVAAPRAAVKTQQAPGPLAGVGGYSATDFPEPVRVRRLYTLALLMHASARPGAGADGKPSMALWPSMLGQGAYPVYLAWAAALTEAVGGTLVLIGMFTRLAALGQAGVMLAATWLTQIGPAVQSGNALLGFLPRHELFAVDAWMPLWWQFALLMMALALFFSGPGVAALDNVLFKSEGGGGGGGGTPKPSAPKG